MHTIDLDDYVAVIDYLEGIDERMMSVGELALIYSVLPEVLLEVISPGATSLMITAKE